MANPSVVVTGASGFLGAHLTQLLTQNLFHVIPVTRKTGYDVLEFEKLSSLPKFDCLVHLAAQTFVPDSYKNTSSFYKTNINGTLNCLELCKINNAQMVFASSYVYGSPKYLPVDEKHAVDLWNPYAASKIIGEQLCQSYSKEFNLPVDILRIFNMYGPNQNPVFVIPKIIDGVLKGKLDLENGTAKRDFVFVDDVCDAVIRCITSHSNSAGSNINIYNVGFGKSYSVNEVIALTEKITGKKAEITFSSEKRKNEVHDVVADISKIKAELGWQAKFTLEDGLKKMLKSK